MKIGMFTNGMVWNCDRVSSAEELCDLLGLIPTFFHADDPLPAKQQVNDRYHFGGWRPMSGFRFLPSNMTMQYPGDPVMHPIVTTRLRDERIVLYPSSWVAIIQPDDSFEMARLD